MRDSLNLPQPTVWRKIWLSVFAANNPRSKFHWQADALYAEAARRGEPDVYLRAFEAARRSA